MLAQKQSSYFQSNTIGYVNARDKQQLGQQTLGRGSWSLLLA